MLRTIINWMLATLLFGSSFAAFLGTDPGTTLMITMGASVVLNGLQLAGYQIVPGGALTIMSSTMITDFKNKFGAFYKPGGQNANNLKQLLWQDSSVWDNQFTFIPLEGDTLEYAIMEHDRVLQPFKPYWSETGQLAGSPRRLVMRRVKANVGEIPDLLVNTWAGWLATEGGKDPNVNRKTWPFVRWYIEKYLIPQAKQDQYLNESFLGIWADPGTNSTPGPAGTALDGLAYSINVDIDAGFINPFSTGAFETDPEFFVEQMEDFVAAIDNRYRGLQMNIQLHDQYVELFKQGRIEQDAPDNALTTFRTRTNFTVVPHFNMLQSVGGAASQKVICSPKSNMIKCMRVGGTDERMLEVESIDYKLKLFTDWHVAYNYWDPRIVFTNDQETDLP